ncbi:MAG: RsmD family RNA methyltransferase [Bacteroidetes bacterium]|nr:RsmD family RNA methyltransferase [Bacteroidota bacterium]
MRIISGTLKGRTVHAPKNLQLRPTTDIAKEALFNILNNEYDFDEISVLDLFAGIGSISLECASRGTTDIVCVERNAQHAAFIKKTVQDFKLQGITVLCNDVRDFLKIAYRSFDIIFADPPYDLPWIAQLPEYIFNSQAVNNETVVIIEHPAEVSYAAHPYYSHTKHYGKVHFSWLQPPKSPSGGLSEEKTNEFPQNKTV